MSGFEIAGIILGAYPFIMGALEAYRATRGGKGAVSLARNLRTEQIIFKEFLHHLVAPNVSEKSLLRLMISNSPDLSLWDNVTLQANMRARLGVEKADNVVEILKEIEELLRWLREELSDRNDHGAVRSLLITFHPAAEAQLMIQRRSYSDAFVHDFARSGTICRSRVSKSASTD